MEKSEYLYLSHFIDNDTPSYGNRDKFIADLNTPFKNGAKAETSNWYFSNNHLGTHIDAPLHFIENGKSVTDFKPEFWFFRNISCVEINCDKASLIKSKDISPLIIDQDAEIILIKTGYEKYRGTTRYWNENPGLSPDLGFYLKKKFNRLRAIGFDFISVTSFQYRSHGRDAHLALLAGRRAILPIEDMSLASIHSESIIEELIVSPWLIKNANGSPVTVLAKIR